MSTSGIIVLDRDGVINEDSDHYIKTSAEWRPISGSIEAMARLSKAGYKVCVATNQSGLARGLFDEIALANMHEKMRALVEQAGGAVFTVCYCPHMPDAGCECRKPGTGLLAEIERQCQQPLQGAVMIGDSLKDLQAARFYNMSPVLVRTGKGAKTEQELDRTEWEIPVYDNLAQATDELLAK